WWGFVGCLCLVGSEHVIALSLFCGGVVRWLALLGMVRARDRRVPVAGSVSRYPGLVSFKALYLKCTFVHLLYVSQNLGSRENWARGQGREVNSVKGYVTLSATSWRCPARKPADRSTPPSRTRRPRGPYRAKRTGLGRAFLLCKNRHRRTPSPIAGYS